MRYAVNMEGVRNAFATLVEKTECNRKLGRTNHRFQNNIKLYLKEMAKDCFEYANRQLDSINIEDFLEYLNDYQLFKNDPAPWS